jgi:2'-5' RNA ligase
VTGRTEPTGTHPATLRNHWYWRPGWRPGRHFYTWHLTFDHADELHHLVDAYQCRLAGLPELDPIPRPWLHLTMQGLGFLDQVTEQDAHRIASAATTRLARLPAPDLTFHQLTVRPEAITLPPEPADPIHRIRAAIRASIAEVWGPDHVPEPTHGYQPHVSLAYVNTDGPAAPVLAAVADLPTTPARVRIHEASLIILNRDQRMYQWRTFTTAPLADSPPD